MWTWGMSKEGEEAMEFRWDYHRRNHPHRKLLGHDWGPRICPECIVREQYIKRAKRAEADRDND